MPSPLCPVYMQMHTFQLKFKFYTDIDVPITLMAGKKGEKKYVYEITSCKIIYVIGNYKFLMKIEVDICIVYRILKSYVHDMMVDNGVKYLIFIIFINEVLSTLLPLR